MKIKTSEMKLFLPNKRTGRFDDESIPEKLFSHHVRPAFVMDGSLEKRDEVIRIPHSRESVSPRANHIID